MKKLIALLIALVFLLAACSNSGNENDTTDESAKVTNGDIAEQTTNDPNVLDVKTEEQLKNTAEYLTKAIAGSTSGFSSNVKNPTKKIVLPNEENQNSIVTFLALMMNYSNPEKSPKTANTIYSGLIYMDDNSFYHLNKTAASKILNDVFAIKSYDEAANVLTQQLSFKYDKKLDEYTSRLEFSIPYEWACDKISKVEINKEKREITVEYTVENIFSFADDAKEEITKYNCVNVYTYAADDSNEYSLKLKSMEVKDFLKETNPD